MALFCVCDNLTNTYWKELFVNPKETEDIDISLSFPYIALIFPYPSHINAFSVPFICPLINTLYFIW